VQAITGKVHSLRRFDLVEPSENVLNSVQQIGPYPAAITAFIKSFEATVLEAPNHKNTR
jgi:hypothetical protein